jgi:hypothetical protein
MDLCDCIKSIDLSNGMTKNELQKYSCLAVSIKDLKDFSLANITYINNEELILILFKAVQQLKNEIDTLKMSGLKRD